MNVFGDVELIVSTDQAQTIAQALEMLNDINIKEIYLVIVTNKGVHHKLTVHDYLINWANDNVA